MVWEFITLEIEPQCLAALIATISTLTEMDDVLPPETESSAPMLLETSASMTGMPFLQMFDKHCMIFLSK